MKTIKTTDAIGHVICHDITRIIKDKEKGVAFKKGHIVTAEDIPVLLSIGKEHLYVWEYDETKLHENEAAKVLISICKNENMQESEVKEGKIELSAKEDGLFVVDVDRMDQINELEDIMISTIHTYTPVKKGDKLLGTRVIPMVIEKEKLDAAVALKGQEPLTKIYPYLRKKAAIITTGSEVFYGRIQDTFTPVIIKKLEKYGVTVCAHKVVNDEKEMITAAIHEMHESGAELIILTGGMSVDPDDKTPGAIKDAGANIISYGAPVLPGAMFLLSYMNDGVPVLGLPGCVMYAKATIFDLMLPRVLCDLKITKRDIAKMGHGGLCTGCTPCTFPHCGFGKGI